MLCAACVPLSPCAKHPNSRCKLVALFCSRWVNSGLGVRLAPLALRVVSACGVMRRPNKAAKSGESSAAKRKASPTRLTAANLRRAAAEDAAAEPDSCCGGESSTKRARQEKKCLDCGATDKALFPPNMNDACAAHWDRYLKDFTTYGTFGELCTAKANDAAIQQDWDEAGRVLAGKENVDGVPIEVSKSDEVRVSVSKSMVGPSKAQLTELLGQPPEKLGVKLQDLCDQHGVKYRGLLIPNPAKPYVEYKFTKDIVIGRSAHALVPDGQIYERHARVVFDYLQKKTSDEQDVERVLTKMRTEPWTLSSLCERAGVRIPDWASVASSSNAAPRDAPLAPAKSVVAKHAEPSDDAADGGDHDDAESNSDSNDGPVLGGEGSVKPARVLNGAAVRDSMVRVRAKKAPSFSQSPAAKPGSDGGRTAVSTRVPMANGLPVADDHKDELCTRRMAALCLEQILSGVALGREARWAKETKDLFAAVGDPRSARFQQHLALVEHAELLAMSSIGDMS